MDGSRLFPDRPLVGVGVVVWHQTSVLLIRRAKPPRIGEWSLPGGAQRLGEPLAHTAQREVMEEAGLAVELGEIVATLDLIDRDPDGRVRYHYTLVDFTAEALSPKVQVGSDASDACWFELDELAALNLWSETVKVIHLAADRREAR